MATARGELVARVRGQLGLRGVTRARWRSFMYVPADQPRRWAKIPDMGCDLAVVDMEDAVAPDRKDEARQQVLSRCNGTPTQTLPWALRVNAPDSSHWDADLGLLRSLKALPTAVVVPKAEDPASLDSVRDAIGRPVPLVLGVETARGMWHVERLAAQPDVEGLVCGGEDYAADVGARRSPDHTELAWARQRLVAAAHAHRRQAIDVVNTQWDDADAVEEDARGGANWGFTGKQCIHPAQLAPVHRGFVPTPDEVAWATQLLEEAVKHHCGSFRFRDSMVDRPLIVQALSMAERAPIEI